MEYLDRRAMLAAPRRPSTATPPPGRGVATPRFNARALTGKARSRLLLAGAAAMWAAAGGGLIAAGGVLQASLALRSMTLPAAITIGLTGWALVWWGTGHHPQPGAVDGLKPGLPTRASVLIPSLPFAAAVLAVAADA